MEPFPVIILIVLFISISPLYFIKCRIRQILLLLSKVTQKHFRQPYRPSKGAVAPYGVLVCSNFMSLVINLRANFIFTCISVYHTFLNTQKSLFYKEIYTYTLITEHCSSRISKVCLYVFSHKFLEILWHFSRHQPKYWLNT